MSSILIHAAMTAAIAAESGLPGEIVYLPEGEHDITPTVNGKAQRIKVRVPADKGEAIAAKLQAALADRQKQNVRPWFDFEHKSGKASAIPTAFRYEAGKGIMASVEWTGAGKAAIEGKDFSYLSPSFLIDDNGIPSGLPERGPLAALVNEPAFREIPRIAASDADPLTKPPATMSLILAHLGIDSAAEGAEKAALAKIQAAESELATIKASLATLEAENKKLVDAAEAATKARHTALVEAAVAAGKIAPKDEDTKTSFLEVLAANEALGIKTLDLLPVKFAAFEKPKRLWRMGRIAFSRPCPRECSRRQLHLLSSPRLATPVGTAIKSMFAARTRPRSRVHENAITRVPESCSRSHEGV